MITDDSIRFGDAVIEYKVRRSARRKKTVQIAIDAGGVQVSAPLGMSDEDLRAIVRRRAAWILRQPRIATSVAVPRQFASGETLPYLGRNVPLIQEQANLTAPEIVFDHQYFRVKASHVPAAEEWVPLIQQAFVSWYRARAAEILPANVDRWWPRMGHGFKPKILVRDQRQRWGSCAHDGTLRFNWRVMMLEPSLVEYIVVHELAHITIRNHSPQFWALVESMMPDVQHRRRRLREVGPTLPL